MIFFFSVTEEHSEFSVKVQLFWKEDICQNCVISYNFKTEIWLRVDYVLQKRGLEPVFPTFPITMKLNIPKLKKDKRQFLSTVFKKVDLMKNNSQTSWG